VKRRLRAQLDKDVNVLRETGLGVKGQSCPDQGLMGLLGESVYGLAIKPYLWYSGWMKTTLDLPDELMRQIKIRAVNENRKLKDAIADLLRRGLSQKSARSTTVRHRVELPLVECVHEARSDEEMIPERVAKVLLEEESGSKRGSVRQ
jgi:hypothetical protein